MRTTTNGRSLSGPAGMISRTESWWSQSARGERILAQSRPFTTGKREYCWSQRRRARRGGRRLGRSDGPAVAAQHSIEGASGLPPRKYQTRSMDCLCSSWCFIDKNLAEMLYLTGGNFNRFLFLAGNLQCSYKSVNLLETL